MTFPDSCYVPLGLDAEFKALGETKLFCRLLPFAGKWDILLLVLDWNVILKEKLILSILWGKPCGYESGSALLIVGVDTLLSTETPNASFHSQTAAIASHPAGNMSNLIHTMTQIIFFIHRSNSAFAQSISHTRNSTRRQCWIYVCHCSGNSAP